METRQTLRLALLGVTLMIVVLGGFYLWFNPHVLHGLLGETWVSAEGDELTSWPDRPHARKCHKHDAYHTDGRICSHP